MLKKHQGETAHSQQGLSVVVSDQTRENSNSDKGTFTEIIMSNGTDQILDLRLSQDNLNNRNSMRFAWEEKDNGWALALQFRGNPLQDDNIPSHGVFLAARGNTRWPAKASND